MTVFDEQLSLGYQSDADIAAFLEHIGDKTGAKEFRESAVRGQGITNWFSKPWKQTSHVYGFIEEGNASAELIPIISASSMEPDSALIGSRIKVTLDAFQVCEYPGFGIHDVLFDFHGRDQAGEEAQDLQFGSVLQASDGARASINGMPVFTGITVPSDGLSFKARTVLIGNEGDRAIIDVLQSSLFKHGIRLLGTLQPTLPQLVALAGGVTQHLLKQTQNKQIQGFELGLDFSSSRTSARLRRGSYIVIQVPGESSWRWCDWYFDPNTMTVVDKDLKIAPHNVIIFAVSESMKETASSASRMPRRKEPRNIKKAG